jgi:hypothetical protein
MMDRGWICLLLIVCCADAVPCLSAFLAPSSCIPGPAFIPLYFPCRRNCLHPLLRWILLSLLHRCICTRPRAASRVHNTCLNRGVSVHVGHALICKFRERLERESLACGSCAGGASLCWRRLLRRLCLMPRRILPRFHGCASSSQLCMSTRLTIMVYV